MRCLGALPLQDELGDVLLRPLAKRIALALQALDAGLLAAATRAADDPRTPEAIVFSYIAASFNAKFSGASLAVTVVDDGRSKLDGAATVDVPTRFMQLLGKSTLALTLESQILYGQQDVEVVLALDNTGSMSNDMDTLREGAVTLAQFLLSLDGDTVSVGVVPFNAQVNIGSSNTQWIDTTDTNPHNGVMLEGRYLGYRATTMAVGEHLGRLVRVLDRHDAINAKGSYTSFRLGEDRVGHL